MNVRKTAFRFLNASLPDAVVGDEYSALIETSGGIGEVTISPVDEGGQFPAGLAWNSKSNSIIGTPKEEVENSMIDFVAVDSEGNKITITL